MSALTVSREILGVGSLAYDYPHSFLRSLFLLRPKVLNEDLQHIMILEARDIYLIGY